MVTSDNGASGERTVPGKYSISEPFDVGVDNGGSVARREYASPSRFSDRLAWVRLDLAPARR